MRTLACGGEHVTLVNSRTYSSTRPAPSRSPVPMPWSSSSSLSASPSTSWFESPSFCIVSARSRSSLSLTWTHLMQTQVTEIPWQEQKQGHRSNLCIFLSSWNWVVGTNDWGVPREEAPSQLAFLCASQFLSHMLWWLNPRLICQVPAHDTVHSNKFIINSLNDAPDQLASHLDICSQFLLANILQ